MTSTDATRCDIELTPDGHLRLHAADAARCFPGDALVAFHRDGELALLPTRGSAGGGLILKQRSASGDRSVLLAEALGFRRLAGRFAGVWDERAGGLRVPLAAAAIPRPQPVGVFAFPRSHLLAPRGRCSSRRRRQRRGRRPPSPPCSRCRSPTRSPRRRRPSRSTTCFAPSAWPPPRGSPDCGPTC